jgi:hypothetical protein
VKSAPSSIDGALVAGQISLGEAERLMQLDAEIPLEQRALRMLASETRRTESMSVTSAQLTRVEAGITADQRALRKLEAAAAKPLVDAAIERGAVASDQRGTWDRLLEAEPVATRAILTGLPSDGGLANENASRALEQDEAYRAHAARDLGLRAEEVF